MQNTKYKTKIQNTKYKYEIQNAKYKTQNAKYDIIAAQVSYKDHHLAIYKI